MSILILSLVLFACLNEIPNQAEAYITDQDLVDLSADNWYITREMWLAAKTTNMGTTDEYNPLRLVIVSHTLSGQCNSFVTCAAAMRNMQTMNYDIPYNFIIGNDGRVYEGRGWNKIGAHTFGYNVCSMGLAFMGDYREGLAHFSKVTQLQQARAHMLFIMGIKLGYLHPNFHVVGASDLRPTMSPGSNLYKAIRNWTNYDHQNLYKNRTCKQIKELYVNENKV